VHPPRGALYVWAPPHARGSRGLNEIVASARRAFRSVAEQEAAAQEEQLRIAFSRAHAECLSAYAKEKRRLSNERCGEFACQVQSALKLWLRLAIGKWEDYGLQTPTSAPLEKHPTVNSSVLEALRHGRLVARRGIERYDGHTIHFTDGTQEEFDAIIMGTGFRTSFPFLSKRVADWDMAKTPPLYLKMMHPTIPSLFFIGLFQPIGCIWQLADYQARIAALQISGRLKRPSDIDARIRHEVAHARYRFDPSPRHAIEVDYHVFRRELMGELAAAEA